MKVLVYGFPRGPGQLPQVMNVARGPLRLRFRALTEWPDFSGCHGVVLPLDTYSPWQEGGAAAGALAGVLVRAAVALRQAAAQGAVIIFLYEDVLAHHGTSSERAAQSLGGMVLEELGLLARRLPAPEDRQVVLAPAFADHLQRFGLCTSFLDDGRCRRPLQPLSRTRERQLTGVAAREGEGHLLILPGYPRQWTLDFFVSLGAALQQYRGVAAGDRRHAAFRRGRVWSPGPSAPGR